MDERKLPDKWTVFGVGLSGGLGGLAAQWIDAHWLDDFADWVSVLYPIAVAYVVLVLAFDRALGEALSAHPVTMLAAAWLAAAALYFHAAGALEKALPGAVDFVSGPISFLVISPVIWAAMSTRIPKAVERALLDESPTTPQ